MVDLFPVQSEESDEIFRLRVQLGKEARLRVQLSEDSQRHLDQYVAAREVLQRIFNCAQGIMPIHANLDDLRREILRMNDARWTRLDAIYAEAAAALGLSETANVRG